MRRRLGQEVRAATAPSAAALRAIAAADAVLVSPISFFEIAQKVRLGKWPEMSAFVNEVLQANQACCTPTSRTTPRIAR